MFRNIIFDWSGTLADDLSLVIDATNTVLRHYGIAEYSKSEFKKNFRLPYPEFYAEVLPNIPLDELEDIFRAGFAESQEPVFLLPHAQQFLDHCRNQGIRCFALTSVDKKAFAHQIQELGVDSYFEEIYAGVHNKLHVIHKLMETHQLIPEETAFIGDMTHDIQTATHAGITSIAVLTGYQNAEQLSHAEPDIITPNLRVLKNLLHKRTRQEARLITQHIQQPDSIHIKELQLSCYIGVPEEERANTQMLKISLTLIPQQSLQKTHDDIANTLNYADIALGLEEEALRTPRKLIETLACDLGNYILTHWPVKQVTIQLHKFILPQTESVGLTMTFNA